MNKQTLDAHQSFCSLYLHRWDKTQSLIYIKWIRE